MPSRLGLQNWVLQFDQVPFVEAHRKFVLAGGVRKVSHSRLLETGVGGESLERKDSMKPYLDLARSIHHRYIRIFRPSMKFPTFSKKTAHRITRTGDTVRYTTIALALETIERERLPGSFAELGVWRGITSEFIHAQVPHRCLYLFDTFSGFGNESSEAEDKRFRNTSMDTARKNLGDASNVCFRVGEFPHTTDGLESEAFSFVLLDVDKFEPTLAGLQFFYPRLVRGGYMFIHDYNNTESAHGIRRSVDQFLSDKSEHLIEIPDRWGSVVFRKVGG